MFLNFHPRLSFFCTFWATGPVNVISWFPLIVHEWCLHLSLDPPLKLTEHMNTQVQEGFNKGCRRINLLISLLIEDIEECRLHGQKMACPAHSAHSVIKWAGWKSAGCISEILLIASNELLWSTFRREDMWHVGDRRMAPAGAGGEGLGQGGGQLQHSGVEWGAWGGTQRCLRWDLPLW